jgi:hypothetical protein
MQIHEVTQPPAIQPGDKPSFWKGFVPNVARGFVQGVTGVNFPSKELELPITPQDPNTVERITVTVSQPGQTAETKYYKTGTVWTNEQGQQITKPQSIAYLDKLIPTHGKKEMIPLQPAQATAPRKKVSRRRTTR